MSEYSDKIIISIIFAIVILLTLFFIIYSLYMRGTAENLCKKECNDLGGIISKVYFSGSNKIDDICICFFEEKIKTFILNEEKESSCSINNNGGTC